MSTQTLTPNEVRMRGYHALKRELGPTGLLRFMHQFERGHGDYSRERHARVDRLSLETILKDIRKQQKA
jgi:hypothetical protein